MCTVRQITFLLAVFLSACGNKGPLVPPAQTGALTAPAATPASENEQEELLK